MKSAIQEMSLQDGSADWLSDWIDCEGWAYVLFIVPWTTVAATNGTLSVQGRNRSPTGNTAAQAVVSFDNALIQWWGDGFTVGATAGVGLVAFESCPAQLRLKYTRVAGGGADQFTPTAFKQG